MQPIASQQSSGNSVGLSNSPSDGRLLVKWLESQSESCHTQFAKEKLDEFLHRAAQPRHTSGNACIKLCYYIEQCRSSKSSHIRDVISSKEACLDLFNFYIEWNEKNQNRSMRQVLELLSSLLSLSQEKEGVCSAKEFIIQRLLSIITHQAAQPLVKPAFKSLECFLGKGTVSTDDLILVYREKIPLRKSSLGLPVDDSPSDSPLESLISEIFGWMTLPDVSPAAGKFLVTLFGELRKVSADTDNGSTVHTILWQRWIRRGLSKNPETLENVKNYLFPPLFKLDRPGSISFLEDLSKQKSILELRTEESNAHSLLQLAAIEVGKKIGLVEEPNIVNFQKTSKKSSSCIVLQEDPVGSLLTHASDTVRSLAFSVLVCSSSSIRPFSPRTLDILKSHMWILYADTDAKFRNDILSSTKHMVERLRGATAYLVRESDNVSFLSASDLVSKPNEALEETNKLLQIHEKFVEWFLEFLAGELIPTASYQRHITALKSVAILLRSGIIGHENLPVSIKNADNATVWPYTVDLFEPAMVRLLLDLVMDPFEDVRSIAATILKFARPGVFELEQFPRSNGEVAPLGLLMDLISRAKDASKRTGRADYADGFARFYELLYNFLPSAKARIGLLENLVDDLGSKIEVAELDLAQAVLEAPIHGNFAALNFVWTAANHSKDFQGYFGQDEHDLSKTFDRLQERMFSSCSRIWEAVKDVLCNDSPEGHLPEDIDEIDAIDTKDVLSYSFRAVHESSNLMRTLVGKIKFNWPDGSPTLSTDLFIKIGDLTFRQLSTLRHRGAFSTVSLTFASCCQLTQKQSGEIANFNLLEKYSQGAFKCIVEQPSTTRRSAGIPTIITGILSATIGTSMFRETIEKLKNIARDPVTLFTTDTTHYPQVHALNGLRAIFKSSSIGSIVEQDIGECLQIAATCQTSNVWPICNSGLLLLRSIIDRLLGTNENKSTVEAGWDGRDVKLAYDNYPDLPALLINLLNSDLGVISSTRTSVELVFPALDIIHRAGVPLSYLKDMRRSVVRHLGNRVWNVRERAARTLSAITRDHWVEETIKLFQDIYEETSPNHIHGVFMTVKDTLDRQRALDVDLAAKGIIDLRYYFKTPGFWCSKYRLTPPILAAVLQLFNTIATVVLDSQWSNSNHQGSPRYLRMEPVIQQLFFSDPSKEMESLLDNFNTMSAPTLSIQNCHALVNNAIAQRAIYTAKVKDDPLSVAAIIEISLYNSTDLGLAAIECAREVWAKRISGDTLGALTDGYIRGIELSQSAEVRCACLSGLGEVLGQTIRHADSSKFLKKIARKQHTHGSLFKRSKKLDSLGSLLANGKKTPALTNAEISASGSVLLYRLITGLDNDGNPLDPKISMAKQVREWGELMVLSGDANKDFDTRRAAVQALADFFVEPLYDSVSTEDDDCFLTSYLAVYDSLNDDDEEIRNLGAKVVSTILEEELAPLPAQTELIRFLNQYFCHSPLWTWNNVCRITGNNFQILEEQPAKLHPAKHAFRKALGRDDALFAEEKQNLFIDEVREARQWTAAFENVALERARCCQTDSMGKPLNKDNRQDLAQSALAAWTVKGLKYMRKLMEAEDAPLGYVSNPTIFATCMRVILAANAIIKIQKKLSGCRVLLSVVDDITNRVQELLVLGSTMAFHPRILSAIQGDSAILWKLRRVTGDNVRQKSGNAKVGKKQPPSSEIDDGPQNQE